MTFIRSVNGFSTDNAKPLLIEGVTTGTPNCNAVLFSHYHGDHIGLMKTILPSIPSYIGEDAKQILTILNGKTKTYTDELLSSISTFNGGKHFQSPTENKAKSGRRLPSAFTLP